MAKGRRGTDGQAGFSVLEAIVAMAILAAVMLPLLAVQGQLAQSAQAVARADTRTALQRNTVAYISALNLDQAQTGDTRIGSVDLEWRASAVEGPAPTWAGPGDPGRYLVTLYEVEVVGRDAESGRIHRFRFNALGWTARYPAL